MTRVTVIGTGYLGAVHAAGMAELGHEVLGIDQDEERVTQLAAGQAPFFEPGLDALLARGIAAGRLRFGRSLAEAAAFGDVHFICVGTPQLPGSHRADLSGLHAVVDALAPLLTRPCVVAGKSTVPAGTAAGLATRLTALAPAGNAVRLAWNPEFLREGRAVADTLRPDRLVVGITSAEADAALRELYAPLIAGGTPYICTDLATAELVKVAANAFLATKISFINAIAEVCEAVGADVSAVAAAMGRDPRIGAAGMAPGLGFGGGCLPKDLRALQAHAQELGIGGSLEFLRQVDEINLRQRTRVVALGRELAGGSLDGRRVGVLGAAFKPGSDDVRDSPALAVAALMHSEGAAVRVHDPEAMDNARKLFPELEYAADPADACLRADLVMHLTEWPQYTRLDPAPLAAITRHAQLVDARNRLPLSQWQAAGWTIRSLGRKPSHAGPRSRNQPSQG